jgi:hypothetical protein
MKNPVIAPCGLRQSTPQTLVPWNAPVPASGTSITVMAPPGGAQEAVNHVVCVQVYSGYHPIWADIRGQGALVGACARAWNVERGDRAIASAQHPVRHVAGVNHLSNDRPLRVDGEPLRSLKGARPRPRSVERDDEAVRSADEPV